MGRGMERLRRDLGSLPRETAVALVVAIILGAVGAPIIAFVLHEEIPVWVLVLGISVAGAVGVVRGASGERKVDSESKLGELERQVATLGAYEIYAAHVEDALHDLRRVLAGELPSFSLRDFVETGIFEPAHVLLQRDHVGAPRGDVRFSILHPTDDGEQFVMANDRGLFPAHGHRPESREQFRLPVKGSFAGVALHSQKVQTSSHLSVDERFSPHPQAQKGREYESIISVPLHFAGTVDGVLNVIATRQNAFSAVDRTYITLLAAVIDVARTLNTGGDPSDAPN